MSNIVFIRTMWNGREHFAIDHDFSRDHRRERLGTTASADIIPITEKQATRGIDKLRKQYFPEPSRSLTDALLGMWKAVSGAK